LVQVELQPKPHEQPIPLHPYLKMPPNVHLRVLVLMCTSALCLECHTAFLCDEGTYTSLLQKSTSMLSGHNTNSKRSLAMHESLQHDPLPKEKGLTSSSRKLLLMIAVGSNPRDMNLVMANINHLRMHYDGQVDVFLNHYDKTNETWLRHKAFWYTANVQNESFVDGLKFPMVSKVISDFQQIANYSWIWVMDEDIDITQTNIPEMFTVAEETGSPIVAPAIRFPPDVVDRTSWVMDGGINITKTTSETVTAAEKSASPSLDTAAEKSASPSPDPAKRFPRKAPWMGGGTPNILSDCNPGHILCAYQKADSKCRFSYTRWVEVMTPLLRPQALWQTVRECEGCITDVTDWGIDSVWCSRSAKLFGLPKDRGCALLDQSPVFHTSSQTLPKNQPELREGFMKSSYAWQKHVKDLYPDDFVLPDGSWKPQCVSDAPLRSQ